MDMQTNSEKMNALREELAARVAQRCSADGPLEVAKGLSFAKLSSPTDCIHGVFAPSVCIIAQGAKEVIVGEERLRYDVNHCLLGSLNVPVVSQVCEASVERPYLSVRLEFDPAMVASVSVESGINPTASESNVKSMAVSQLQPEMLDAFVRLVRLLDDPVDFRMVSPLVAREIVYRLLRSEHGARLRQMAIIGGHEHRIAKAVQVLSTRFNEQISIESLAQDLGMSASSFHQHFRTVTSMSPLQFQKQVRLQEARRLLLIEDVDSNIAAARVGYEDASQFTREYKRMFGAPPKRDADRLRTIPQVETTSA